eukprot:COSAG02_NODE_6716_length_3403_cov_2.549334_1_plen_104_part_10
MPSPSFMLPPSVLRFSASSFRSWNTFGDAAGGDSFSGELDPSSGPVTKSISSPVSSAPAAGSGSGDGSSRFGLRLSGFSAGGAGFGAGLRSSCGRVECPGGGSV